MCVMFGGPEYGYENVLNNAKAGRFACAVRSQTHTNAHSIRLRRRGMCNQAILIHGLCAKYILLWCRTRKTGTMTHGHHGRV